MVPVVMVVVVPAVPVGEGLVVTVVGEWWFLILFVVVVGGCSWW